MQADPCVGGTQLTGSAEALLLEHSAATHSAATHSAATHSSPHTAAHSSTHSAAHSSTHTTSHATAAPQPEHSGIVLDRHDQVADAINLGNHLRTGVFRRGDLH